MSGFIESFDRGTNPLHEEETAVHVEEDTDVVIISSGEDLDIEEVGLMETDGSDYRSVPLNCECHKFSPRPPKEWREFVAESRPIKNPTRQVALMGGIAWIRFKCCDGHWLRLGRILGFRSKDAAILKRQIMEYWQNKTELSAYRALLPDQFRWL